MRIRDRYGVDTFRRFFEYIVEQCQRAGLVWGKELYFDGTQVEANTDHDAMCYRGRRGRPDARGLCATSCL
jgi:transposase